MSANEIIKATESRQRSYTIITALAAALNLIVAGSIFFFIGPALDQAIKQSQKNSEILKHVEHQLEVRQETIKRFNKFLDEVEKRKIP